MKILLKNGTLVDPAQGIHGKMSVLIEDGRIAGLGEILPEEGAEVVDVTGKIVMPGLIDMHCHLRDPGYEYKEDIASGTRAAAMGGFTSVVCMGNTKPFADNAAVITYILDKARREGRVRVYPVGTVTVGLKGEELTEMADMLRAGAVAFSDDGRGVASGGQIRLALEYAKDFDALIMEHCEDMKIAADGYVNEGLMSTLLGLQAQNAAAEEAMLARDLILAEHLNARIHLCHVTTKGGVELIRLYKNKGVRVTAETAPHYLAATEDILDGYDTNTKVNPPLRTAEDQAALKAALADGTLDAIATDHAPHHSDEKRVEYALAASGISGFETAFALSYTELVKGGVLTLDRLVEVMSGRPAEILGLEQGTLKPGAPADIAVMDVDAPYAIDVNAFVSKGKNNPFHGRQVYGRTVHTLVNGVFAVRDGKLNEV
ncbi:dihydroorotase [Gehongia tenuis]|uniref:Dihydroorotase n=1 Tax=Gehongia tenuis TaxID=2763655 RepID=A0A926HQW5_9FIRM|nr:dihydroorotase [Gehongia tenuis]MBC8532175.1 dihydroorotase [Gehongia tenuis]